MSMKIDLKSKLSAPTPKEAFNMMLGGTSQKDIRELEISSLIPYPNQPFRPYSEEKLLELAEDIKENGVLSPVIVRPMEDGYQILAGHNRVNASKLAGLLTVPCIVKDFDDAMAQLVLVNSNLLQRQELLPSEKAFAYKMQLDAIKQQGKRSDLTLSPMETKFNSAKTIAEINSDSRANIFRYVRLTELIPNLLTMVDGNEIPLRAGIELSYLNEETQSRLLEYIEAYHTKIDLKAAELLRAKSDNGDLTRDKIISLLSKPPKEPKEKTPVKLQTSALQQYFPGKKTKEIEKEIMEILEKHFAAKLN
ncbi:ParB/RepB/Spo0J family partition protein [Marasmitruncus massiliensis]|uniref:ParB/RepB/Spo0J family partition protein n=1 Tax=Marasmitruncus massiliensis TaxID=1944642 RepID=UPI000C7C73F8|nr:ParB/RepB/Spo0J family partition protein [Marasmitruncus massiliensis]